MHPFLHIQTTPWLRQCLADSGPRVSTTPTLFAFDFHFPQPSPEGNHHEH